MRMIYPATGGPLSKHTVAAFYFDCPEIMLTLEILSSILYVLYPAGTLCISKCPGTPCNLPYLPTLGVLRVWGT